MQIEEYEGLAGFVVGCARGFGMMVSILALA